jgi:hypothetical protein
MLAVPDGNELENCGWCSIHENDYKMSLLFSILRATALTSDACHCKVSCGRNIHIRNGQSKLRSGTVNALSVFWWGCAGNIAVEIVLFCNVVRQSRAGRVPVLYRNPALSSREFAGRRGWVDCSSMGNYAAALGFRARCCGTALGAISRATPVLASWRRKEGSSRHLVSASIPLSRARNTIMLKKPLHPGEILRQKYIEPAGITVTQAARQLGV